jgi:adenosylmethionine-8-amino-7-oxononanoate aminotransferase
MNPDPRSTILEAPSGAQLRRQAEDFFIWPLISKQNLANDGAMIFTGGSGFTLTDADGKEYLDVTSSWTRASTLGYGNEEIAQAVHEQLLRLHYAGTVAHQVDTTIELAAKLAELTPGRLVSTFFVSGSGSEANEAAFKLARLYHQARGLKPRAYKIICRWNGYHGAVGGAQAANDWLGTRQPSEPAIPPGISHIPAPACYRYPFGMDAEASDAFCADYLEQEILHQGPELVAAFIAEPVMQANGAQPAPPGYFARVREICSKYDVLFIADEVITGFGRTGEWFAMNHWDIEPDLITMAKGITAGYIPLGAVTARKEIWDALPGFPHVHTFDGHPAATAAALATIRILERESLIERARDTGEYLLRSLRRLEELPLVGQVRGLGMWVAVDFTSDKTTKAAFADDTVKAIALRARELGVILGANGTAIEMAPSLNIGRDDLDTAVATLDRAIREVAASRGLL